MKRVKRIYLVGTIILAMALVLAGLIAWQFRGPKIELAEVHKTWLSAHRNTIRYAPLPDAPPFDFIDDEGVHQGITADYIDLIEKGLGVEFVVVRYSTMQEIKEGWEAGEFDLIGSLQNLPERRKYLHFSKPYYSIGNVILMRTGAETQAKSLDELIGLQTAMVGGTATYDTITEEYPLLDVTSVSNVLQGFELLSTRRVDAFITDNGVGSYYIEQRGFPNIESTAHIGYDWQLHFAAHRSQPTLKRILDHSLASIPLFKRLQIHSKWMAKAEKEKLRIRIRIGLLIFTILAASCVSIWNRMLKRQVRYRTHELGRAQVRQQEAAQALDKSEQRFRALVESSSDMIWEIDRRGNYTYMSPRAKALLGLSPDQLVGQSIFANMIPVDAARMMKFFRKADAETGLDREVTTHLHNNGEKVILESSGKPFHDGEGGLAGFRGVSHDITDRIRREAALRESEERFRSLVETTSDWIWETNVAGIYTYSSPQIGALLGYAPSELMGRPFTFTMPKKEATTRTALFKEMEQQGVPIHAQIGIHFHREGRVVVLETNAVPYYDKAWKIQGFRGISRDITERVAAEKKLAFERSLFRSFMKHVPNLIYFKDSDGRFIEVNTAKAREVGLQPDELVGKTDFDFFSPEQAQQRFDDELKVMQSQTPLQKEEYCDTPSGGRWYITTKMPRYDEEGRVAGTFGTSWDITYRKEAAEELRKLRAQLSNIIDSMPSILVGVNADGLVTQWNREAELVTQRPAKEAVGKPLKEVFPRLAKEMVKVERAIREKTTQKEERIAFQEGRSSRYSDITVYPLLEDEAKGAVIRIDDVTDRIRIEEMMVQSEKMMSVGGLAAGMAHEINNPLAGILQNLQVIYNRLLQPSDRNVQAATEAGTTMEALHGYLEARGLVHMLDSVTEAGERAAKIVDNMLSFSRKDDAHYAPNDLADLLERSVDLASNEYNLKKRFDFRHIKIEREFDASLEPIPCEASQIQQVMLNLLSNSAQAMADAEPPIETPRIILRLKRESDFALIEVEDNGPGMEEDTRKRVFEPFFTTKEVGSGTGLGLAVSFFIITENHGGSMRVRSIPGQGTCFSLRIPFVHKKVMWGLRL